MEHAVQDLYRSQVKALQQGYRRFLELIPQISGTRLFLAVLSGTIAIIWLSAWSHNAVVGYGYGAILFSAISWPFVPRLARHLFWPRHLLTKSVAILMLSILTGSLGDLILGRNPQAAGLSQFNWTIAKQLLWQFPLVLPVENLLLIGAMVAFIRLVQVKTTTQAVTGAILAAFFFGLWHVPFWGWGTLLTIGLTVVPWTLYMMLTGDVLVPVVAHVMMDGLAMLSNFAPNAVVRQGSLLWLVLAALVWNALKSWWHDHHVIVRE